MADAGQSKGYVKLSYLEYRSDPENRRKIKLSGGIVLPPAVAYYPKPKTIEDVTDFLAGKILDVLKVEHNLYARWQ